MKITKQLSTMFLTFALLFTSVSFAVAKDYTDIPEDYWAATEIEDVVSNKIVPIYGDNTFKPLESITRVDWTTMLLRALGLSEAPVTAQPKYSDVAKETLGYDSIARSDQFGLIYGYTNGEFKPQQYITKAEAASILSHITKDSDVNLDILSQFTDNEQIPSWAKAPFAKAIKYGLYVNYPNDKELNPNRLLNRAEAAVLLSKLKKTLNLVEEDKKSDDIKPLADAEEYVLSVEHLDNLGIAAVDRVSITNKRRVILAKNVFEVSFVDSFNSAQHQVGDEIPFYFKKDIVTKEGTLLIPANTKLFATIEELTPTQWKNKNAEVYLHFTKMVTPNGKETPFIARVLNKNEGVLTENKWAKPLEYTVAGAVIGGTAIGLPIGLADDKAGTGLAIGIPTGAGVGLATGFLTKGVNYKAKANENVLVELKIDCSLYNE